MLGEQTAGLPLAGANPFAGFDAIYCINLDAATERWQRMRRRFALLGIAERVRRFAAVATPNSHHVGCALSHRAIVEQAARQGLRSVLVFEDDAIFLEDTLEQLSACVAELARQEWNLFHLGGHCWEQDFPDAPGCRHLRSPCRELTCSHAVAYSQAVYGTILAELPADREGMRRWLAEHRGIDQYFMRIPRRFLSRPAVASQRFLLAQEEPALRQSYTLGEILRRTGEWGQTSLGRAALLSHRATGEVLALNATAAIVMRPRRRGRTLAEIRRVLQAAYPEQAARVEGDLEQLVAGLARRGVLERC